MVTFLEDHSFCKYWGWKWTHLMKKILICIYAVLNDKKKTYFFSDTMECNILYFYKTFNSFKEYCAR